MPVVGTAAYGELYTNQDSGANGLSVGTTPIVIGSTMWDGSGQVKNTTTNITNGSITVSIAGIYRIAFTYSTTSTFSTQFDLVVRKNAVATNLATYHDSDSNVIDRCGSINGMLSLAANDIITVYVNADAASKTWAAGTMRLTVELIGVA